MYRWLASTIGRWQINRSFLDKHSMDNWRNIVESNIGWLVPSVRRIVGNDHDAEDVVQEVFVEAYALARETQVENWPAMLRRMSQRRAIDQLRRKSRTSNAVASDRMEMVPSDQDSPSIKDYSQNASQRNWLSWHVCENC